MTDEIYRRVAAEIFSVPPEAASGLSDDDIEAAKKFAVLLAMREDITDHLWIHRKSGGHYSIVIVGAMESTLRPMVVYRSLSTDSIWIRPAAEFFDGRFEIVRPAGS